MLSFVPLTQVPRLKPVVASWLLSEWPAWYGAGGPGDLDDDVNAFAVSGLELPVGIVALEGNVPIGFGALKKESIPSHRNLSPWAAAGYVLPGRRGHGIGSHLLQALVEQARGMGFGHVYCGTTTAVTLLRRSGWQELEQVLHEGKVLSVFRSGA